MKAAAPISLIVMLSLHGQIRADSATITAAGSIPADATDQLGETIGGIGSAIALVPGGLLMLSDRGAGDGGIDYRPRMQRYQMDLRNSKIDLKLQETIILRDADGRPYSGFLPDEESAMPPQRSDGRHCIDPEGLAIARDGRLFISDEYLPSIREFTADGKFVRLFDTPEECLPQAGSKLDFAANELEELESGREPNRGFEGLAIMPDGRTLAVILQSGLVQDGARSSDFVRLFLFDIESGKATASHLIPFTPLEEIARRSPDGRKVKAKHRVFSSLAALQDGRLVALERENFGENGGADADAARWKSLVLLDLEHAENVLGKADVKSARPASSTLVFNLAALDGTSFGLPRDRLPAKWEAVEILTEDVGSIEVLMAADNDFLSRSLRFAASDGEAVSTIEFPRAVKEQATWLIRVRTPLPTRSTTKP
jgi:hypothetical protein